MYDFTHHSRILYFWISPFHEKPLANIYMEERAFINLNEMAHILGAHKPDIYNNEY